MRTEDLINALVVDLTVSKVRFRQILFAAIAIGSIIAAIALSFSIGVRPDIGQALRIPRFLFKFVFTLSLATTTAGLLWRLARPGVPAGGFQIVPGGPAFMHPGRSGLIQFGPKNKIGAFGEIHPRALEAIGAEGPLVGFEIILNDIPVTKSKTTTAKPKAELSEFMPLQRDFAFVVERAVAAADIVKAALAGDRAFVAAADVFDVYEGAGIAEGQKSVAISVTLQPRDRTLTEAEIDAIAARIVAAVRHETGATLRG